MRWTAAVADAASIQSVAGKGPGPDQPLLGFRSLLPQGRPLCTPRVQDAHHTFTISNASVGPHGGILFRVEAMVHGHRVRCLIDCGATSDFVSMAFVKRHGLEKLMLATEHRVRGYDGQITPAAGVLAAAVTLSALGEAKDAPLQQLLVAQLHSDDVILGLPWLVATGAVVDFAARSVALNHAGQRHTISLAEAAPCGPVATSQLMESVLSLYSADVDDDNHVSHGALATLLRGTDDRGSMRLSRAASSSSESSALDALRKRVLAEHADVFPDKLPPGLPPGRGHELRIKLRGDTRPPSRQPLRKNQKLSLIHI